MKYLIQLILYCLLFTLICVIARGGSPVNVLYFFPDYIQDEMIAKGATDRQTMTRKMILFYVLAILIMGLALIIIIAGWNQVRDFWPAFFQANFVLQLYNVYDGIVMDKVWLEKGDFWTMPGYDKYEYIPDWPQVIRSRLPYIPILFVAAYFAGKIVELIN